MKKIIILLALILINTQVASAIQETQDEFMGGTPSFETMNKQLNKNLYIPAKTEEQIFEEQDAKDRYEREIQKNIYEDQYILYNQSRGNSIKPLQLLRLKIKKAGIERKEKKLEKQRELLTGSEEVNEVEQQEKEQTKILLECKQMEYITDKKELQARGGAKLTFPSNNISATADEMVYNQVQNIVKMTGNVVLYRGEEELTGDYMQVDLNEEVSLLDNMKSQGYAIETIAEQGIMRGDTSIQKNGHITVNHSYKLKLRSGVNYVFQDQLSDADKYTYEDLFHDSKFVVKSNHIIIHATDDLNKVTLKKMELYKNGKRILKLPSATIYQNKGQDFVDGNYPELGSRPKFGMYVGPGWVMELPKGRILKLVPLLNYSGKVGIGGMARFRSATNSTEFLYGSASNLFTLDGRQELDKNLYVNYGMNTYMRNGWLGRGWAKYIGEVSYEKRNVITNFFGKRRDLRFEQLISAGYIQDDGKREAYDRYNRALFDKHHNKLQSKDIGTARFRYMINTYQILYHHENPDKLAFLDLYLYEQASAAIYGTGDSQFIGRIGPMLRTQLKYWTQDVGFYASAYSDNTPVPIYDAYRYGKFNVYLREAVKVHKLLKLSWYGSANLSNDAPDGRILQESRFIVNIGPDDMNLALGWDAVRQGTYIGVNLDMDAKSSEVYYDKMEIKNPDKFGKRDVYGLDELEKEDERIKYNVFQEPETPSKEKLQRCQILDIQDSSLRMENEKGYQDLRRGPQEDESSENL